MTTALVYEASLNRMEELHRAADSRRLAGEGRRGMIAMRRRGVAAHLPHVGLPSWVGALRPEVRRAH
jgi:hypothetical protein